MEDLERMVPMLANEPVGRMGNPEEVTETVVWLCSDAASFVTRHIMTVDGGYVAQQTMHDTTHLCYIMDYRSKVPHESAPHPSSNCPCIASAQPQRTILKPTSIENPCAF